MSNDAPQIVDVDDRETWPDAISEWVERWGDLQVRHALQGGASLAAMESGTAFRELLAGQRLLAYHSTRLLKHEEEAIRVEGLLPVSAGLVQRRIDDAWRQGFLSEGEREELHRINIFARHDRDRADERQFLEARERGVYLLVGRTALEEAPLHLCEWLSIWGGPAIYEGVPGWPAPSPDARFPTLRSLHTIGRPTIIASALEYRDEDFGPLAAHTLGLMFSCVASGEHWGASGEVCFRGPVRPEDILAVGHPGDPEYDRHPELPRS
jgi:hypothetical protein